MMVVEREFIDRSLLWRATERVASGFSGIEAETWMSSQMAYPFPTPFFSASLSVRYHSQSELTVATVQPCPESLDSVPVPSTGML